MNDEHNRALGSASVQSASSSLALSEESVAGALGALRRLVGTIAATTGETPRSILEDEFKRAPSDDFWRAKLGSEW